MMAESTEPRSWSTARMSGWVAVVFMVQVGLIFWLGERNPIQSRTAITISGFQQVPLARQSELVLENPTLFALPERRGFSGEAWMNPPALPVRPFAWTEPPRWLPLSPQQLGNGFTPLVGTDSFALEPVASRPAPELTLPVVTREAVFPEHSVLRVGRGLTDRQLERGPRELPSWPNAEVLTSSVVQVAVDQEGRIISATLLRSSGLRAADAFALERAWEITLSPCAPELIEVGPKLTLGELVFEWHTLAQAVAAATQ